MKKADFKKMAMLGITVGLSVAATSSACCGNGKGKQESDSSSDLLSSLNKASEGFYLAHGGCAPGKCSGEQGSRGTGTGQGNISMADDAQPSNMMQGGRMQNGQMQGDRMQDDSMQRDQNQGQDANMQNDNTQRGRAQNGRMQNGQTQDQYAPTPTQTRPSNRTSSGCAPAPRPNGMDS